MPCGPKEIAINLFNANWPMARIATDKPSHIDLEAKLPKPTYCILFLIASLIFKFGRMKVTVSHAGKQHSYHLANALLKLEKLDIFFTSSYIKSIWLQAYFQKTNNTYWSRRFYPGLGGKKVDANWRFEVKEVLLRKFLGKSESVQNAVYQRDADFDAYVSGKLQNRKSDLFWGFQGSCHSSLQAAKTAGKIAICELATAHVASAKKILGEEIRFQPDWADSMDNLVFPAFYERRLMEEPHLADFAVAASAFTRMTLLQDSIPEEKIINLPLGFDISYVPFVQKKEGFQNRPLKLLYAGTVTQRKGIAYLLEAMEMLGKGKDIELHIIGGIQGSGKAFMSKKHLVHYHPPVSQLELFSMYSDFDVLVLPTIFEGFGLVLVEAMAAGLPIISTQHSIGPELVTEGKNGFIVPIRDSKAIAKAIESFRAMDDHSFLSCSLEARKAAELFTWNLYQNNLDAILKKLHPN